MPLSSGKRDLAVRLREGGEGDRGEEGSLW
jgi:hypothetical protein